MCRNFDELPGVVALVSAISPRYRRDRSAASRPATSGSTLIFDTARDGDRRLHQRRVRRARLHRRREQGVARGDDVGSDGVKHGVHGLYSVRRVAERLHVTGYDSSG